MHIKEYRLKDFINTDLKVFSNLDNYRSIPSIIDGFKDSQRKAVFAMINNGNSEIKVAQLGSYAAKETHYAHGEVSMCDTIINLAQNFPGSNNMNLFEPIGQFGSILSPEASAPRYIYTKPSKYMRKLLRVEDDLILENNYIDGDKVEPINYFPVLPIWLINWTEGIGTGHATKILPRNPKLIAQLMHKLVSGVTPQQRTIDEAMTPWFGSWKGLVKSGENESQWEIHGVIETINTTTLRITELPVTYNIDKYKELLIKLMDDGVIKNYESNSSEDGYDITVTVPRETGRKTNDELKAIFKLVKTITENVTLWDVSNNLTRYTNAFEALKVFVELRQRVYENRRLATIGALLEKIKFAETKIFFISFWNTSLKDPHKKARSDIEKELAGKVEDRYFDQLFSMQIGSLTMERVEALKLECDKLKSSLDEIQKATHTALYQKDLTEF